MCHRKPRYRSTRGTGARLLRVCVLRTASLHQQAPKTPLTGLPFDVVFSVYCPVYELEWYVFWLFITFLTMNAMELITEKM